MTEAEVAMLVRERIAKAGSLRGLARQWGISPAYLSDLTNGRRGPGSKVLDWLDLERVETVDYRPKRRKKVAND